MCTVTFVRSGNKTIITSNRDEQVLRPNAIEPKKHSVNGKNLIYPKDPKAGGSWYVVDENGTVLVLLNGAGEKHRSLGNYRKSRGLIALDIMSSFSPINAWLKIDLTAIEPFTLVLFENQNLHQLRWDGEHKEKLDLDARQNHIWSSTTLYPKIVREERARWFFEYMNSEAEITENGMFNFHQYTKSKDHENGLVINRNGVLKTLSITQSIIENNKARLRHYDLINQNESEISFIFI